MEQIRSDRGRRQPPIPSGVVARHEPTQLTLTSRVPLRCQNGSARAMVAGPEHVDAFRAAYEPSFATPRTDEPTSSATTEDTCDELRAKRMPGDPGAHGIFGDLAHERSVQYTLASHRAGTSLALALAGALARLRRR